MADLANKVALVTGAGSGIGRGIALALATEGAAVSIADIDAASAQKTADEIGARGGKAIAITGDVRVPADIERSVEETVRKLGGINILVNNAQTFPLGPLLKVADEAVVSGFISGPIAHWRYMRACYPYLKGGGVVIGLSSPAAVGIAASSHHGIYSAAKAGIQALIRTAALEWAQDGIRAFAILPVGDSKGNDVFMSDPAVREHVLRSIPLGRIGDSEKDIGGVVAFLCSDRASYMTGCTISVDGGASWLR